MNVFLILLAVILLVLSGKWLLILLVLPFQILEGRYRMKPSTVNKMMAAPYVLWERLFRGG